ncbi:methylamine utilization protein MauJ [Paenibacillus sp. HB172176]|uniref:methylamine utilization protein MauJ n=1 Tax=Paenibacillus sp. HB172176 TaxID=2493690 RepID=UPI0014386D9E|nr:methylamine utilization protein MauJ [Paenibacillus sp. HB172176]
MTIWEVELFLYGMIKVKESMSLRQQKGREELNPFFSDIEIKNFNDGVVIKSTAYAPNRSLANSAALIFIGQMVDCLVVEINEPISISNDGRRYFSRNNNVKRYIELQEFISAFEEALFLNQHHPTFLKAYGWYRKGITSEDAFDSFLALWNSIEIVTSKYHPRTERTVNGSKSQIWESFKSVWGECQDWPLMINGNDQWIDQNYLVRNNIAHGLANVNVEEIDDVISRLVIIKMVSIMFLKVWKHKLV